MENQAIVGRQLLQAQAQKSLLLVLLNNVLQTLFLATRSDALLRLHGLLRGSLSFLLLKLAETTMVRDAIEPRRKTRLAAKGWQPLPRGQKRLLSDFAGLIVVLHQAQAEIEDATLMSLHEQSKGILVPLLTGFHELLLILLGGSSDDIWENTLSVEYDGFSLGAHTPILAFLLAQSDMLQSAPLEVHAPVDFSCTGFLLEQDRLSSWREASMSRETNAGIKPRRCSLRGMFSNRDGLP